MLLKADNTLHFPNNSTVFCVQASVGARSSSHLSFQKRENKHVINVLKCLKVYKLFS